METTWRECYRPLIADHIEATAHLPEPERSRERRRLRRECYPCDYRRGWAYRCWLDEWRRQLGLVSRPRIKRDDPPEQLQLPHIDQMALPGMGSGA